MSSKKKPSTKPMEEVLSGIDPAVETVEQLDTTLQEMTAPVETIPAKPKRSHKKKVNPEPVVESTPTPVEEPTTKPEPKKRVRKPVKKAEPKPEPVVEVPTPEPVTPEPTPEPVVESTPEPEPVKEVEKSGYQLEERSPAGLSGITAVGTSRGSPVPIPNGTTPAKIIGWLEELITYYRERSLWLSNSGLKTWGLWLLTKGMPDLTEGEYDKVKRIIDQCVQNRDEPREFTVNFITQKFLEERNRATGTVEDKAKKDKAPKEPKEKKEKKPQAPREPGNGKMESKDSEISGLKVTVATGPKGGRRFSIDGLPITSVLRWMGSDGWTFEEARKVCSALGIDVRDATLECQVISGKKGDEGHHGTLAVLNNAQKKALRLLKV